jgi:hypothetical protein
MFQDSCIWLTQRYTLFHGFMCTWPPNTQEVKVYFTPISSTVTRVKLTFACAYQRDV